MSERIRNEASAPYTGIGRRQVLEETFYRVMIPPPPIDPLAQTFRLQDDRFITSLDLFFSGKEDNSEIIVQLREVSNGFPNMNVMASVTVKSADVKVSNNASLPTRVRFKEPVLLFANTTYCFVVLTQSAKFYMWYARLGSNDVLHGNKMTKQPYEVGAMFSSSNGESWTVHQDSDLKFNLYSAVFGGAKTVNFGLVDVNKASKLVFTANQLVPKGTSILWYWSDNGNSYNVLGTNMLTELGRTVDSVYLRCTLTPDRTMSPIIDRNIGVASMGFKNEGKYIARELNSQSPFTNVTLYIDLSTPSGTTQFVEYSIDGGTVWEKFGTAISSVQVDEEFTQYKFQKTVSSSTRIKIRICQSTTIPTLTPKAKRLMLHMS